jgi:hypothetical protein
LQARFVVEVYRPEDMMRLVPVTMGSESIYSKSFEAGPFGENIEQGSFGALSYFDKVEKTLCFQLVKHISKPMPSTNELDKNNFQLSVSIPQKFRLIT